jgi:hypothetical protein
MTRISNVDQVLMLLRQQLQRLGKSERSAKGSSTAATRAERRPPAPTRIEAVLRDTPLSEEDLARTLIQAMLVDEFGEAVANDHKFQNVSAEVYRLIAQDPEASRVLSAALVGLRKPSHGDAPR